MLTCLAARSARALFGPVRLVIAAGLLWVAVEDQGPRTARLALSKLPDFDFVSEVSTLRSQGCYGESIAIADAGLETTTDPMTRSLIESEREKTVSVRDSWARRLKDAGAGALTGSAAGPEASTEALVGAVVADFFIIGDIRDLTIQAARAMSGREVDPVIVALSGIGVATTLAPEIDWAPSVLKLARRTGAMTEKLGEWIVTMARRGEGAPIKQLFEDSAEISRHASPAGAVRLLHHVEGPEDARMLAAFLSRNTRAGSAALHTTGDAGIGMLREAEALRSAGKIDDALRIERVVLEAGAKGERGRAFLKSGAGRIMARPHVLVGALKGVYKGHASALLERALRAIDPIGWWLVPVLAGWTIFESLLLLRRVTMRRAIQKQRDRSI
jgi:hypothetical protein